MRSLYIDTLNTNLQIHDSEGSLPYWLNMPLEGFDFPEVRMTEYDKPGEDGSVVSSQFYGSRAITLPGIINADNPTQYQAARKALATACQIEKDSNGYPVPKRISFTTLSGDTYFMDAYFKRPVFDETYINHTKFLLQLVATSPFIYDTTPVASGAIVRASGGGFILPVILPITSASAIGGTAQLTNNGNGVSMPVITLTGPLTNPYMFNQASGKTMQLNYTIPSGDTVVIDMLEKTILLNGTSSILSAKADGSEWWGISPGLNQINFSTGSSADTGNMQILFYPSYLGV